MKIGKNIGWVWSALVGFVFSLVGLVQPGVAALPPEGVDGPGVEPKNRVARPEPVGPKTHRISFESPGGGKSKGAIAMEPDGRIRGLIAQEAGKPTEGKESQPPVQNKKSYQHYQPAKERTVQPQAPAKDKKWTYIHPAPQKEIPIMQQPGKDKGLKLTPAPGTQPGKDKALKLTPAPDQQPGKDKGLKLTPGPGQQSMRPEIHDPLALTDEQKDRVVLGSRDQAWLLNEQGLLERRLPDGVRAVIQEQGWVQVYDADSRLRSAFQDARAEKIEQALRIAGRMKRATEAMPDRGEA